MKKLFVLFYLLACILTGAQAQQHVTLKDVAQGTYRAKISMALNPCWTANIIPK